MVGIKGTGMSALAEILMRRGATVTGSDTDEVFYTDAILKRHGIPYVEGFDEANLPDDVSLVIYSAAYDPSSHPELLAAGKRDVPILMYTDALGELSRHAFSVAIAGVHGKTTTTALVGSMVRALELPGTVLVGSAVRDFGERSTLVNGSSFFVAETCEYRRHFLAFHPSVAVVTSVEADHLDYFRDAGDVDQAFFEFVQNIPDGGTLIYCADDEGAARVARRLSESRPPANDPPDRRPRVTPVPYGRGADGPFRLSSYSAARGEASFELAGFDAPFSLSLPGEHLALNASAALAALGAVAAGVRGGDASPRGVSEIAETLRGLDGEKIRGALSRFAGSARRSEVLGEAGGVLFVDDYAHHPTAIRKTLRGFRDFYAPRRLIVDFMSHTYTRTDALLAEFATAFGDADEVILHKIYASARERYDGSISGRDLADAARAHHGSVRYFEEVMEAMPYLKSQLHRGDLFVTMGAGNNWELSHELYRELGA